MSTLDRWRWSLKTPATLSFPHLKLIGRDHEPPIVVGAGEVRMQSPREINFVLRGVPTDVRRAIAHINFLRDHPYDVLAQCRLIGTDSQGVIWQGGYTVPAVDITDGGDWTYSGELTALFTDDVAETVSKQPGTELIFMLRVRDPMTIALARYVRTQQPDGEILRQYKTETLNSEIGFAFESADSILSVTASESSELQSVLIRP